MTDRSVNPTEQTDSYSSVANAAGAFLRKMSEVSQFKMMAGRALINLKKQETLDVASYVNQ